MPYSLQQLSDAEDIKVLKHRYFRAIDTADEAEGIWYLEDIFVDLERNVLTIGSALYKDRYKRVDGAWKIARTEYDRILELVEPIRPELTLSEHYLAKHGRKGAARGDISHLITWFNK